ncbi:hypothetical protein [Paracoccus sp. (in: a-proteobacteria)]|uniref:hypothetical protein n=1 Tax=Paracoccus sp. TaxID=267 RepID=UPI0028AA091D|nr:hypothetical protein [Paracoccus sp. (in: a-proteobacteria)]
MPRPEGILALLDSRSFGSIWFWVILTFAWTMAGRRILGVPSDVITRAIGIDPGPEDDPAALRLLDWLSLTLPRWRIDQREGAILLGLGSFLLTTLAILGFGYGLEMAQALVLLILPFALLFALELRLAGRLRAVLARAEVGLPANEAGVQAARQMRRHRVVITALSILAVALTAFYGAIWMIVHPFGY